MAELKRHISSRQGFRAHLKKLLQTLAETLSEVHPPLSEDRIATLKEFLDQFERKQELISSLDAKILEGITVDAEIEAEILQTEEINSSISNAKAKIMQCLKPATSPAATPPQRTTHPTPAPVHEHTTWLPKLDLPHYSGSPLHWQSFWTITLL